MKAFILVWSAAWRAQAMHWVIFVLLPFVATLLKASVGVVFLPFLLLGEGSSSESFAKSVGHLRQPGCWVVLMPCSLEDRTLIAFPEAAPAPVASSGAGRPGAELEPFIPLPGTFTVRHAWFASWLVWFVGFLVLRERSKRAT